MTSLFDVSHPFWQMAERVFDLMMLNLLAVCASLPLVTLGMAKIALQACLWQMEKGEKIKVWPTFWQEFRSQWRQGLILSLLELALTGFCLLDLYLVWGQTSLVFAGFRAVCIGLLIFSQLLWVYIYPLAARYDFQLKDLFIQAFFLSGGLLLLTVKVSLTFLLLAAFLFYSDWTLLIGLVCLLSFAYAGLSFLFIRELGPQIRKYEKEIQ